MSIENVRAYFRQFGMEDRVMEKEHSSATVEAAAEALGCEPQRIAKTLSFETPERVCKAKMLKFDEVEERVGHAAGGVCPFAVREGVQVYLDESLKRFETVFPAAGSGNSMIELTIPELEKYSGFSSWVDVCKEG